MGAAILAGFWVGAVLLFVGTVVAVQTHRDYQRTWRTATTTGPLTCRQLQEPMSPRVVVVARTSTQEIISEPLGGEPCICYWTELNQSTNETGASDPRSGPTVRHSVGRIVIEDETGTAVISEELAVRNLTGRHGRLVVTKIRRWTTPHPVYRDGYESYSERVWYVPPGVPVYVIGSVRHDDDGPPLLDGEGGTSTRVPDDVVGHLAMRDSRWAGIASASALAGLAAINVSTALIIVGIH